MGVLNLTPDSFSDGGRFVDPQGRDRACHRNGRGRRRHHRRRRGIDAALWRHASRSPPRSSAPGWNRCCPPVVGLGKPVSIDTMKAEVADWAIRQGAAIANDVWGLQRDPDMARVVADHGVPVIVMHNRDRGRSGDRHRRRHDRAISSARSRSPTAAGVRRAQIVIDPGIGFGKTPEQSVIAVAQLARAEMLRPADPDRAVAQALHLVHRAVGARRAAGRLDRRASAGRAGGRGDRAHA